MSNTGLLAWGQAGEYDGVDDRTVISALANNRTGLIKRCVLSAATTGGLDVQISAFQAVVDCGDGTSAVVASHDPVTVTANAGPGSGTRTDVAWCDIDPDAATWTINIIDEPSTVGRLGQRLGGWTVPSGANLATAFTFIQPVDLVSIPDLYGREDVAPPVGVGNWDPDLPTRVLAARYSFTTDGNGNATFSIAPALQPVPVRNILAAHFDGIVLSGSANVVIIWQAGQSTLTTMVVRVFNLLGGNYTGLVQCVATIIYQ